MLLHARPEPKPLLLKNCFKLRCYLGKNSCDRHKHFSLIVDAKLIFRLNLFNFKNRLSYLRN